LENQEAVGRITLYIRMPTFIDLPAAYVNYFGEEGLNDEGAR